LTLQELWQQFAHDIQNTGPLEYVAVFAGIVSVWFSRIENILVYPVGLINTVIYIYLSFEGHLLGEAAVNFYYTVMSVYGWLLWSKRNRQHEHVVQIRTSSWREIGGQVQFFFVFYVVIFCALTYLKKSFATGAIPLADAFASATAFTAMWLMAKKKVESWYWWIATNIASIPLYFAKHYVLTSVYYLVLLVLAVFGLMEWLRRAKKVAAPGGTATSINQTNY
jgi:nicotinamide mononucleotide transporter